jgi:hypothetical protein
MDLALNRRFPFAPRFLLPAVLRLLDRKSIDELLPLGPSTCGVIAENRPGRVRRAFTNTPANTSEVMSLRALLDNPGSTNVQLSKKCGWVDSAWQLHLITICHRRRHDIWPDGLDADATNATLIGAISDYDCETLRFTIKEDIVELFREILNPT